ncbi:TPA: ATP-dependent nuclease [Listeria monocytogenes]
MSNPYLSKVKIKNFRNFKDVSVYLEKQQIVIGENNVGKTNFIRAIQLILDPSLSEEERYLNETDFFEGLESPFENNEIIEIEIELRNYENNLKLLTILSGATVSNNPDTIRITYQFFPEVDSMGNTEYKYRIFQGENKELNFGHNERRFLNMKVIPPIRDVEKDIRSNKKSPIKALLKDYDIDSKELEAISEELDDATSSLLDMDELKYLTSSINNRFSAVVNSQIDLPVSFKTMDIAPTKLLNSLKIVLGESARGLHDTSLGINNLLYISLLLLSLEDNTVPNILSEKQYNILLEDDTELIIDKSYKIETNGKRIINSKISKADYKKLYAFMDENYKNKNFQGFSILVIEEPEAHLHPAMQRTIYKDIFNRNVSMLMTTHSPHITSVAPINSIVHLRKSSEGTLINSTANLNFTDGEQKDLERYIDVKRGELYFGKGILLVEGVAEEYLIPEFSRVLEKDLDKHGIICCNINSTNFKPYYKFLRALKIPTVIITDGDFYFQEEKEVKGKKKIILTYHKMQYSMPDEAEEGFEGNERMENLVTDLEIFSDDISSLDINELEAKMNGEGIFVGYYTLEIDIFKKLDSSDKNKIVKVFNELTAGGDKHKANFKQYLNDNKFDECLKMIEGTTSKIGKGRFAQRLSMNVSSKMVPKYIEDAINYIVKNI